MSKIECPNCNSPFYFDVVAWDCTVGCLDCDTIYTLAMDTRPAELITAIARNTVALVSMGAL